MDMILGGFIEETRDKRDKVGVARKNVRSDCVSKKVLGAFIIIII